jgi:hypothetical protein
MSNENFEPLASEDVLLVDQGILHRQTRLLETIAVITESSTKALESWPYVEAVRRSSGVPASVLRASGGGWQKGKLRIRVVVEFEQDQSPQENWPPDAPT